MLKELSAGNKDTKSTYINLLDLYGMAYKEIGLINQGMNILFRALALAEHKQLQIETAILYNNIAATYMQQGRFSKADSLFTKATLINENLKDKSKLFVNYNNLSVAATKQKDYNKALEYAFLAMHQLDTRSDSDLVILMQRNIGGIYLHQNQPSLALQQLTAVKHYQERHQQTNYLPNTYNMLAEIYQHNDDSLKHYLLKALNTAILEKSEEDYSGILYKLANLYERKKDYRTANRYFKQYTTIKDSLLSSNEESQVNSLLHMYLEEQKQHQKIESIQLQQYQTLKQMRIVLSAATILVLLTVLYSLLRLRKEKKRYYNKIRNLLRKRQDMLTSQRDKIITLIEKLEQKENEINLCQNKQTVLSLQAIKNQEFTTGINEELKQLLLELNPRDTQTKRHIRDILSQINQMSNDSTQKEFVNSFENIHQKFYDTLSTNYPTLTIRELRLCALIRIGLSNKEIADITFREIRSVEAAKNRLRKKLALPQQEDLAHFLIQF